MKNVKEYFKPATVQDAVKLLQQYPEKAVCIAGGTHVAAHKDPSIEYLVDLTYCGLNTIREQNAHVCIGACVTLEELQESEIIRTIADAILAKAARWTGSVQRRNAATVGGSVVLPQDLVLPLLALDAQLVIEGSEKRTIPLAEFYTATGTVLQSDDIITECRIPAALKNASGALQRQSRTRQDVTIAAVAAVITRTDQICQNAAIAVTPVESGMCRISQAEHQLQDKPLSQESIAQAVDTLKQAIQPVHDHRAGADYRRKVLGVYTKRALFECFGL
jgi:carbon-monoxide dehydrogenase medium subunit